MCLINFILFNLHSSQLYPQGLSEPELLPTIYLPRHNHQENTQTSLKLVALCFGLFPGFGPMQPLAAP